MSPIVRSDLLFSEVGEELIVFDPLAKTAHHLNDEAASIFLDASSGSTLDLGDDKILRALAAFAERGLLDRISRRKLIANLSTGLAAPLIASVLVPTPAAAASESVFAIDDIYETEEDSILVIPEADGVLANDLFSPPGTASLVEAPSHGSVTLDADGSFTYIPDADYVGLDTFLYQLTTSAGSAQATVIIQVLPVG